jgi:glycine hydroxymethyltransferase
MAKSLLKSVDTELAYLIRKEGKRQFEGIELIASENFTSDAVLECLGSCLTNKYSEGLPGRRYYGGNQIIDKIENLCIDRALKAFRLDNEKWGVNVQPYSGSVANLAAYNALLKPGDRIMGLDLPSGGHLTHGFYTANRKVSVSSVYYQSLPYEIDETGYINYDQLDRDAKLFKPNLIICGASAYPRDYDYKRFRQIAETVGAYLMGDISHISGLVVTGEHADPFEYCDVVTTTTHKTLRGPRSAMIFGKKELMKQINESVFPGLQGGPHQHQIAGVATQLREVQTPEFKKYIQQVKSNAKAMAQTLTDLGYKLSSGGTDNHLLLVDLRDKGLTGSKVEWLCDQIGVTLNKNSVYGDKSALVPGGIRIGTPAMTTKGYMEEDFIKVAHMIDKIVRLGLEIQGVSGRKMVDFIQEFEKCNWMKRLTTIRQ